jgi:prepilin-type N-terminal cleavage/methylation domain-containing protein
VRTRQPTSAYSRYAYCRANAMTPRNAFTLLELVISMAIASILLVAMQSVVLVAARAIPDGRTVGSRVTAGAAQITSLTSDLFYATAVSEMTATAITFTVPDVTGDGAPDTVRYAWSGNAGAPLTRQVNGGAVVSVLPSVQSFNLVYDKRPVLAPTTYATTAETLFVNSNGSSNLTSFKVSSNNWPGQSFTPERRVKPSSKSARSTPPAFRHPRLSISKRYSRAASPPPTPGSSLRSPMQSAWTLRRAPQSSFNGRLTPTHAISNTRRPGSSAACSEGCLVWAAIISSGTDLPGPRPAAS